MDKAIRYSFLLAAILQSPVTADNWAHWRGPTGNGVAPGARPPIRWSSTGNVKWKVAILGRSSGSPVIWEDRVFVVSAVPVGGGGAGRPLPKLAFKVLCFDRNTGQGIWEQTATVATPHQGMHPTNSFASASLMPSASSRNVPRTFSRRNVPATL